MERGNFIKNLLIIGISLSTFIFSACATPTPLGTSTKSDLPSPPASTPLDFSELISKVDKNGPTFTFSEGIYSFTLTEEGSTKSIWSIRNNSSRDKDVTTITYGKLPDGWEKFIPLETDNPAALEAGKNYVYNASTKSGKSANFKKFTM